MEYDVVVIGAGAAGMMAAGTAAESGKKVLLIEKMEKAGRKIRITGKGRCNLTNTRPREEFLEKVKANREFFEPSFDTFGNNALIKFFRKNGVKLAYERGERVFPASGRAWEIADALTEWLEDLEVEVMYHTTATGIRTIGNRVNGVYVRTRKGYQRTIECSNVIICTGGVSYPSTGSTGDGYVMANKLGHDIVEVRPSLVALKSRSAIAHGFSGLKLKNVNVSLIVGGVKVDEKFGEMEFGTRGIEGPVILQLSREAVDAVIDKKETEISLDIKPALTPEILTERIERELAAFEPGTPTGELLRKLMPKPMVRPFSDYAGVRTGKPFEELKEQDKQNIIERLKDIRISIDDYGGFEEAVITAGGVDVSQVDPQSLRSKLVSGLYFAGEVLDIDADTGGYNLQIAFSTGRLAGKLRPLGETEAAGMK